MTTVTPDSIMQVASGFMASKHLFVANEVGLFECLAEGQATLDDDAIPNVVVRPVRPKLAPEGRGRSAERNF